MANFQSDEHAALAGVLIGVAAKHGLTLIPVTNDDGYTPRFEVKLDEPGLKLFITVDNPVWKPIDGPCPTCNSKAGEPCTSPTSNSRRNVAWFHSARGRGV